MKKSTCHQKLLYKIVGMVNNYNNCVNNEMLEHDWLLTAHIYGLTGCFRSKLSDLTCPITNICNRAVKQPIEIKHFMPLANKLY